MNRQTLSESLVTYNLIFRDTEEIYHGAVRRFGLSYCAFWILYLLRETDHRYTQSEICQILQLPRQTVNSALKTMLTDGLIVLEQTRENRKNKLLRLTPKGLQVAAETVDRVIAAELDAMDQFSPEELEQFLHLGKQYAKHLREQFQRL
jgi:DNA-binding MarR family transcriptional regulator